ncbi:MAG: hypothetical protein JWN07_3577 [Hyphomicrobiales bacterium]|nr:hypothetical protein [Hyphomicrobiales bacterium]
MMKSQADLAQTLATPTVVADSALILKSFHAVVGRPLLPATGDARADSRALFDAPFAVLAHGTQDDPVFFYGNACALRLFEMDFTAFTRMPSRLSAEPMLREERQALLARAAQHGFIDDYAGIRISSTGARFRIENVILWTLTDEAGVTRGQAAYVPNWRVV